MREVGDILLIMLGVILLLWLYVVLSGLQF
jgi:hypothetical protein